MRIFLDANVLFSASKATSNIGRLIQILRQRGIVVTSDFALEEARRNILLKRPEWSKELDTLIEQVEIVPSVQFPLPVELVEKDQPILCTAIRAGCQYLVTGDNQDFGHLYDQTIEGVMVVSLIRLAEVIMTADDG